MPSDDAQKHDIAKIGLTPPSSSAVIVFTKYDQLDPCSRGVLEEGPGGQGVPGCRADPRDQGGQGGQGGLGGLGGQGGQG